MSSKHESTPSVKATDKVVRIRRGSVLFADLPADMKEINARVVRRMAGPELQNELTNFALLEEADNATLTVEVSSLEAARKLQKRLQNANVHGRRWKVQCLPASATQCSSEACLVECALVPPAPLTLVERALSAVPGFLTIAPWPEQWTSSVAGGEACTSDPTTSPNGATKDEEQASRLLLSFVDEGCALHARALLSGRVVGSSGVRMFLTRRQS